jgi:GNAT superfamily N-acetyltransferase
MSADTRLRELRPSDVEHVVGLWNRCLTADPVTRETFEEKVLLDPNFDPAGGRVAEREERVIGFAYALVRRTPLPWGFESLLEQDRRRGWILAILVEEAHRREGIGSALLSQALDFLRTQGAKTVILGNYAPNYVLSGVDTEAYPGAREFFEHHGFAVHGRSHGMGIDLFGYQPPAEAAGIEQALAQQGVTVEHFSRDSLLPTLGFLRECFPTWLSLFTDKLQRGHDCDEMVIARRGEEVVGYCQHRYGHQPERTGPFGVKAELRGRKIGTLMLYRLLAGMAQKGYRAGWFAQTGDRQRSYYERVGYRVVRTEVAMSREL